VVQACQSDPVASIPCTRQGAREGKGERRHVRAKNSLPRIAGAQEVGGGLMRRVDDGIHLSTGFKFSMPIRLMVDRHLSDSLRHPPWHLRASRAIQVDSFLALMKPIQGREMLAY
jgi:hypothetical protein